jgi:hypothetical protein
MSLFYLLFAFLCGGLAFVIDMDTTTEIQLTIVACASAILSKLEEM